jgi:hypothetical protein
VNFDGTGTVAISDSENVSSVADNGTGDYSVNFTIDFADGDYSATNGGSVGAGRPTFRLKSQTSGSFNIITSNNTSQADATRVNTDAHGDLA